MTTHTPDDEVLSALLDAEPVGSDAAHVANCAECQQRLAELRKAAHLAATPPAHAPAPVREAAVAWAVAVASGTDDHGRVAAVIPFRRRSKPNPERTARRRVSPLSAAAAMVAVVVAAGFMLNLTTGGGDDTTDSGDVLASPAPAASGQVSENQLTTAAGTERAAADSSTDEAGLGQKSLPATGTGSPAAGHAMSSAAGTPAATPDGGELGDVDDLDEIAQRAESDLAAGRAGGRDRPCRAKAAEGGRIDWQAGVNYKSKPAVAYVVTDTAGKRVTQVLAAADCSLLGRQAA